ncbi:hypothetical protein [Mesorhizobium onobrychidis]|uniref:Uncharacterized protein n=1 Tax=Mesorhizobium onobrychidis TaxID=2775404 RepID=A0ABY5QRI1_9HYPH|nr:hypothetical protein [Mesorhizobium onobrychidis]UVC12839.1 hypothetical protein IHQ72_18885 [Mesorhizobium onobrychidis]
MSANDNKGVRPAYILGTDPEGDLCSHRRTANAATYIHAGLREVLNPGSDFLVGNLRKSTAYHNGLTNIETQIAIIRALALMQIEMTRRISDMNVGSDDEDDDDCGGAA